MNLWDSSAAGDEIIDAAGVQRSCASCSCTGSFPSAAGVTGGCSNVACFDMDVAATMPRSQLRLAEASGRELAVSAFIVTPASVVKQTIEILKLLKNIKLNESGLRFSVRALGLEFRV